MMTGVLSQDATMFDALREVDLGVDPMLAPGEHLRRARVARGLSLADIARRTRVSEQSLAAIERCDFAGFQARVYAVGCARSYARSLDIDETSVVAAVGSAYREVPSRAVFLADPLPQRRRGVRPEVWFRLGGLTLAAAFALTLLQVLTRA